MREPYDYYDPWGDMPCITQLGKARLYRASTDYRCSHCNAVIPKGTKYQYATYRDDDNEKFLVERTCYPFCFYEEEIAALQREAPLDD